MGINQIMEGLSEEKKHLLEEFKSITGLESDDEKIISLLTINDFNLNNSISNYFDSGFDSLETNQSTTGAEVLDTDNGVSQLRHRNTMHQEHDIQRELFLNMYMPKLPKAPRITNQWQLDIGIYSSLNDVKGTVVEKDEEKNTENAVSRPINTLWFLLLIIPKSLLQVLISVFRLIFGSSNKKISLNSFPKSFNFEGFDLSYNFLDELSNKLKDMGTKEDSNEKSDNEKSLVTSVLDNFDIVSENFNEIHEQAQRGYTWLLVILVDNNLESNEFLKRLLINNNFNKLFNKKSGTCKECKIFVQNINKSPEAFEVGKTYNAKRLPFIALVSNVSNNPTLLSSMSVVYKSNLAHNFIEDHELDNTVRKITKNISKAVDSYNPQIISQRADQQEIEFARLIKQQQDDAYIQSLERDKLKKMQKENELRLQKEAEELNTLRSNTLQKLITDKWTESLQVSEPKTKIAIKLPNGKRAIEALSKSITVNQLYLFVELKLYINEILSNDEFNDEDDVLSYFAESTNSNDPYLTPDEFISKFQFKFKLIQPFPTKEIPVSDEQIENVPELKRGGNLLVEFEDGEESEDESIST